MIKNKWLLVSLVVCACIAVAVAMKPASQKVQVNGSSTEITAEHGMQKIAASQTGVAKIGKQASKTSGMFSNERPAGESLRNIVPTTRVNVTEAEKQIAVETRSLSRQPRTPSLDQGSDNCTGVPDLGSATGVAVATGTTAGFTNNIDTTGWGGVLPTCWQGDGFSSSLGGPDVYYKWTAPSTGDFTFSLCQGSANGNQYDTGISLWNFTCPTQPTYPANFICGNDDGGVCVGNFGSELACIPLTQGQQILIVIDGYGTDSGPYSLDITICGQCDLVCPNGGINEGEPTCGPNYVDTYNAGCNSDPATFQTVTCGQTICGESGTFVVNDTSNFRDTDWYRLVLTDTTLVTFNVVAEFAVLNYTFAPGPLGFECDSASVVGGPFTANACDTLVVSGCLEPGEYWFVVTPQVFTGVDCGSSYIAWWECAPCAIDTGCVDGVLNVTCPAGGSFTGNTTGAGNDCWVSGTTQNDTLSEDQIIQVTIPTDGLYRFSMCTGTTWDTYIFVTDGCCSGTILNDYTNDDDRCGTVGGPSETECLNLTAGTYYVLVEGWQQTDGGAYTLTVECCQACVVTCNVNEQEGVCFDAWDGTNDGCNMDVPAFETVTCGATICGRSGNYAINDTTNGRDLDWYAITIADTSLITVTATAEYQHNTWILSSNCNSLATLAFASNAACSTNIASACLAGPGTYLIVVGPTNFTGTACGARYQFSVACEPCVIPESVVDCAGDDLYGQRAHLSTESWGLIGSDARWTATTSLRFYDNFTLDAGEVIGGVTFWGGHVAATTFNNCTSEDIMSFEVAFWADSSNRTPDFSTGPLCRDTVTLASVDNGQVYHSTLQIHGRYYHYEYPEGECCSLATGVQHWLSVQAVSVGSPDCRFMSLSSASGNLSINPTNGALNVRSLYTSNGTVVVDTVRNRALCLSPCPTPCFPVTNLTVYPAAGNGAAWLNFTAPQAAVYQIYSTTNPNADDDPDNGSDADYALEASVFFAAGNQSWTAPAGFANYKKFVVLGNCQ